MYLLTKRLLLFSLTSTILLSPKLYATAVPADTSMSPVSSSVIPTPGRAIAFTPPAGWLMANAKELPPTIKVMVVGTSKTSFPPSICLGFEPYQGSLRQYIRAAKATSDSQGCQWKDLGKLSTEAGTVLLYQEDMPSKWGLVREMHAILEQEGTIYMLTAAAAKDDFSNHYQSFFEAVRSLRFVTQPISS